MSDKYIGDWERRCLCTKCKAVFNLDKAICPKCGSDEREVIKCRNISSTNRGKVFWDRVGSINYTTTKVERLHDDGKITTISTSIDRWAVD